MRGTFPTAKYTCKCGHVVRGAKQFRETCEDARNRYAAKLCRRCEEKAHPTTAPFENTGKNEWAVQGSRGDEYTVRYQTKLDELGSLFFVWTCDCPAGRRGRNCKHVQAVQAGTQGTAEAESRTE